MIFPPTCERVGEWKCNFLYFPCSFDCGKWVCEGMKMFSALVVLVNLMMMLLHFLIFLTSIIFRDKSFSVFSVGWKEFFFLPPLHCVSNEIIFFIGKRTTKRKLLTVASVAKWKWFFLQFFALLKINQNCSMASLDVLGHWSKAGLKVMTIKINSPPV